MRLSPPIERVLVAALGLVVVPISALLAIAATFFAVVALLFIRAGTFSIVAGDGDWDPDAFALLILFSVLTVGIGLIAVRRVFRLIEGSR